MKTVQRIQLLAIINCRIAEIKELDGTLFGNGKGYEPKEILVPKVLERDLTEAILDELQIQSPLSSEDINFKRYKGLPITYINNHRDFNGQFGYGFPIQVSMRMRTTEEHDAILDAIHKAEEGEKILKADTSSDLKDNSEGMENIEYTDNSQPKQLLDTQEEKSDE